MQKTKGLEILNIIEEQGSVDVSDKGVSDCFIKAFQDILLYGLESDTWFYYDKGIWEQDTRQIYAKLSVDLVIDAYRLTISKIEKEELRKRLKQYTDRYDNSRNVTQTILEKAARKMIIHTEEFDKKNYLLNCLNGTVNLETMEFYEHRSEDFLTKITNAEFHKNAQSEKWDTFIDEITNGDKELARYLQRIAGYCLSGKVYLDCLFIVYGSSTRNGKSTFINCISKTLGSYAGSATAATLSGLNNVNSESPSPILASLAGKRFVSVNELPRAMTLNENLIKQFTGRNPITARHLQKEPIRFQPTFKLFIDTNHLPTVSDNTVFESKRIRVIEFNRYFGDNPNRKLEEELTTPEGLAAILAWMVKGWEDLKQNGEQIPASVSKSTLKYAQKYSSIDEFIKEATIKDMNSGTPGIKLLEAFCNWCDENKEPNTYPRNTFYLALRQRGYLSTKKTINGKTEDNYFMGIVLK